MGSIRRQGHFGGEETNYLQQTLAPGNAIPVGHDFFNELWAPGSIVYFKPVSQSWWCCGLYQVSNQWTAEWAEPEDLHELIISLRSVEMHFPNLLRDAYRSAATRLGARVTADDDDA